MPLPVDMNAPPEERLSAMSPGEAAEWDRSRVEEDPNLWDAALLEKHIKVACETQGATKFGTELGLPDEVEPCQERLRGADGTNLGAACQPLWKKGGFWCQLCDREVLIMRAVPAPLPDTAGADSETGTGTGVVNMRSRSRRGWRERWGG